MSRFAPSRTVLFGLALELLHCASGEPAKEKPLVTFEGVDAGAERLATPMRADPNAASAAARTEAPADSMIKAGSEPSAATSAASADGTTPSGDGPRIAAMQIAATVYSKPNISSERLGYVRLGGSVARDPNPVAGSGCHGKWYHVYPLGYMCTDEATIDLSTPLVRAAARRPDLSKPLPYAYGFVRATAPQYLRVPTKKEQLQSEFKLEEHMDWYRENRAEVQRVTLGANDIPLDSRGFAVLGQSMEPGFRLSTQKSTTELLGGSSSRGTIPFWLTGGRGVPNVADFKVPDYAVFADRVRRKTGLSFVDAFVADSEDLERRFAVTVDLRLIPGTKVKPDTGSQFHGVEIGGAVELPFAFVSRRDSSTWKLIKGRDEVSADAVLPRRALIPLSGKARFKAGERFYQIARDPQRWLKAADIGVVAPPPTWPEDATKGAKWIDVSLTQQTLVLYEGQRPIYATLISSGRDRLGDPKTTLSTPRGEFRIRSKHVAAAMDSEENSSVSGGTRAGSGGGFSADAAATAERLLKAEREGQKLDEQDQRRLLNVKKGRNPEYGVTQRRGAGDFELRDVPWIQYFASGYALHGAYWHDVFGTPRSHGCINLSPIDARIVFRWTDPPLPEGWHGMNVSDEFGAGTLVVVRE
jgi:lipoprotein-anchoring transpeptidase ErfK/SrfK